MNSGAVVQTNAFSQAPPGQASSRADQARYYTMQGLCLVKIPPGQKKPLTTGWQRNPIRKPTDAARHWSDHPNDNMGVLLGASGLVSLDVDDLDEARACLGRVGIDLDRLLADPAIPKIQGNPKKVRLLFQAPAGDKLTRKALRNDDVSVFELRGGSCQDVLPPSVHPETKQPYRWVPNPWEAGGIPVLPAQLLTLWRGWDELRPEMATEQIQAALREYQRRSPASSDAEWDAVRTEIRGRLSVDKKLREMGVRQTGQKFSCPFHLPDKNPSFWVHEDIWVCAHSGAPVGYEAPSGYSVGDVIDLHQYQLGFDSPGKAAADLARKLGVATPEQTEKTAERCSDTYSNTETSERSIELQPETAAQLIEDAPEVDYLVEHILPSGGASLVAGESGIGKTWVTLDLAISVALGRPWLAHFPAKQGNVLVIDEENAKPLLRKRLQKLLKAAQLDVDGSTLGVRFLTGKGINLSDPVFVSAVERVLAASSPDLVIIDSLVRIHTGNENDAGDMAKLFAIFKGWMNRYGCSFVFCHHRRKPGVMGNDSAHMFRGSSEIRAFVDTHLDLREVKDQEESVFTVEHSKSRYEEPIASFTAEIVDVAEGATEVRYIGEAKNQAMERLLGAQQFLVGLVADKEWHRRREIIEKGGEAGFKQHTLDTARKLLIDAETVREEKRGKETGIVLEQRSDAPDTYKVSEQRPERLKHGLIAQLSGPSTPSPQIPA